MNTKISIDEYVNFSLELTEIADAAIMPLFRNCKITIKEDGSEVTIADKIAELKISEKILDRYPHHKIWGEEFGQNFNSDNDFVWIIDPIDGTTWFSLGAPVFGTLISLLYKNEPIVGVIHFPAFYETIFAGKGKGCWIARDKQSKRKISVAEITELSKAFISASGIHASNLNPLNDALNYNLSGIISNSAKFRFCGDCLQHSLVCMGSLHAAIDTIMKPWDIAALVPCIEEAGGIATDLQSDRINISNSTSLISSCNPILHDQILQIINS